LPDITLYNNVIERKGSKSSTPFFFLFFCVDKLDLLEMWEREREREEQWYMDKPQKKPLVSIPKKEKG